MATPSADRIAELLAPYVAEYPVPAGLYAQLERYLDVLLRWNARTNLTAIRAPEEIVKRHFGESLFTATHLAARLAPAASLLDFGSGAGFPGLPIRLLIPTLHVTLAESQGKKAAFLREAVRVLALTSPVEIWPRRVNALPPAQRFDVVTLRAVDNMPHALSEARSRLAVGGLLAVLGGAALQKEHTSGEMYPIPGSRHRVLVLVRS